MTARLAAPPWKMRFRNVSAVLAAAALIGGFEWLDWGAVPVADGPQRWESARITGFAPGNSGRNGADLYVVTVLRTSSGMNLTAALDPAAAARCRIGDEVSLRIIKHRFGNETLTLPPNPCR